MAVTTCSSFHDRRPKTLLGAVLLRLGECLFTGGGAFCTSYSQSYTYFTFLPNCPECEARLKCLWHLAWWACCLIKHLASSHAISAMRPHSSCHKSNKALLAYLYVTCMATNDEFSGCTLCSLSNRGGISTL